MVTSWEYVYVYIWRSWGGSGMAWEKWGGKWESMNNKSFGVPMLCREIVFSLRMERNGNEWERGARHWVMMLYHTKTDTHNHHTEDP
ncbi:hypothetical protein LY76DRAFT_501974 [Colletotrichum caudatum]|nr:hypothetical protein LY76DRAFT_501974 [Colletotrichum caudatum]